MLACASMAAVVGSHSWSPFEPWFSPFLPHATILMLLVLIGHLVGRHWQSSAVLAVAGFVGVWSWTNALQFQKSTALHPADAPVISAGFANLGISKAPPLGSSDALQDWAREKPFDLFGVLVDTIIAGALFDACLEDELLSMLGVVEFPMRPTTYPSTNSSSQGRPRSASSAW